MNEKTENAGAAARIRERLHAMPRPSAEEDGRLLRTVTGQITAPDEAFRREALAHWDSRCKPLGGFGDLETMVARLAGIRRTAKPVCTRRAIVIFGADNGVVAEGVSQTGSEVTAQVLRNMGDGITSVCRMSEIVRADVIPVNIGTCSEIRHPGVINCPVRAGTGNIAREPAMSRGECLRGVETGIRLAAACAEEGYDLLIAGEMGIGNTTTSAALASALFETDPALVTGRGAGLSDEGLERKIRAIQKALMIHRAADAAEDPIGLCARIGGLDIAGMTGLFLGGAAYRLPVWMDGVVSGIAACLAAMLCPGACAYFFATHNSAEPASAMIFERLGLSPVLDAHMHLGEGTGAAAVLPLLDLALHMYDTLPGFDQGKVKPYRHLSKETDIV